MYEAEKQIIAYFFLGSARIFLGFGSTKNPARLGSTILRLSFCGSGLQICICGFLKIVPIHFKKKYGTVLRRHLLLPRYILVKVNAKNANMAKSFGRNSAAVRFT